MNDSTNVATIHLCNQRILALTKHFTPATVVKLDGVTGTVADLIAVYQGCLDERASLAAAQAKARTAILGRDAADEKRLAIELSVRAWLVTELGSSSDATIDFGVVPKKKRARPSAETRLRAKRQAEATRKARGTMSKKQRAKIHGVVEPEAAATATTTTAVTGTDVAPKGRAPSGPAAQ